MKNLKITTIISFFILFCWGSFAHASTLEVVVNKQKVPVNGFLTATIILDAENNPINTIEGTVIYDSGYLIPEKISIGNSFISFWIDKPVIKNNGMIHFSGIVPGGVAVSKGEVFSVSFKASHKGDVSLSLQDVNLLLNDGQGTKDKTNVIDTAISIIDSTGITDNEQVSSDDKKEPEDFSIIRTRNSAIFDNKYFIVFSTQDKESGIDHYEICEFFEKNCIVGESPYELKHQTFLYRIFVKAYDAEGNVRKEVIVSPWLIFVFVIFLLALLFGVVTFYRRFIAYNKL
ncbi:MAG: cohesin domain-containing protein [bacterium]